MLVYVCIWFYVCVRQARSMQSWHITATPLGVTNQITLKWFPLAWIFVPYKSRDGVCGMSGQKKHLPKNILVHIYISSHTDSTDQTPHEEYHILLLRFWQKKICITNFDAFSKFLHKNKSRKPHACSTILVYSHETHTHINCTGHRSIANQAREIISCVFSLFFSALQFHI